MVCLAELHSHTTYSDGRPTPEEVVLRAAQLGLSAIAITDHNTFRGSAAALEAAKELVLGIHVIPGDEVRTSKGDVIVLCPSLPHEDPRRGIDPYELRDWASTHGCITIAAHPFQPGRKGVGFYLLRNPGAFDAVEAWNARGLPPLNWYAEREARKLGKPMTSGSDAHVIGELGRLPTAVLTGDCSAEGVIDAIRKGACSPSRGMIRLSTIMEALRWSLERRLRERGL